MILQPMATRVVVTVLITASSYGAYVRPILYSNEVDLRMLIDGAAREAAVLGYHSTPLFSYYAYHGPVFRVLLRLNRGKVHDNRHYGFIGYCHKCGNSKEVSGNDLGSDSKLRSGMFETSSLEVSTSLVVSGPLWTGPLLDAPYLMDMLNLAKQRGWVDGTDNLGKFIKLMIDESDPKLPFGYIKLDEKGYAASRSHIATNAIKTNCPMTECISIARELLLVSTAECEGPSYRPVAVEVCFNAISVHAMVDAYLKNDRNGQRLGEPSRLITLCVANWRFTKLD